jgi:uncharacterized GH25 family protein
MEDPSKPSVQGPLLLHNLYKSKSMKNLLTVLFLLLVAGGLFLVFGNDFFQKDPKKAKPEVPEILNPEGNEKNTSEAFSKGIELQPKTGAKGSKDRRQSQEERTRFEQPKHPQGVRGRVFSFLGQPVPKAKVFLLKEIPPTDMIRLLAMMQQGGGIRAQIVSEAKTDALGRFALRAPATKGEAGYEVHIVAPKMKILRKKLRLLPDHWEDLGLLKLEQGKTLFGQVRQEKTKTPIPGATVLVRLTQMNVLVPTPGFENGVPAKTDSLGRFEISGLPDGPFEAKAFARGFGTIIKPDIAFTRNEKRLQQNFDLPRGYEIEGWVVDSDGKPIPRASVEAIPFSTQNPTRGNTRSDQEGHFAILGLAPGQYMVKAEANGFVTTEKKPVKAGDKECQVVLERQSSILVRVLSKRGTPVRNYRLEVKTWFEGQEGYGKSQVPPVEVRGAKKGVYELSGLNPGNYILQAEALNYAISFSNKFRIAGNSTDPREIQIQMSKGGTIRGRVVDTQNRPIAGASVQSLDNSFQDNPLTRIFASMMTVNVSQKTAVTDRKGNFTLKLLTPASYQLMVDHPSYSKTFRKDVQVRDEQVTDVGTILLRKGGRVEGIVLFKGAPLPGAKVSLSGRVGDPKNPQMVYENVFADAKGRFKILRSLPAGEYEIQASRTNLANPILAIADIQRSTTQIKVRDGQTTRIRVEIRSQ